MTITATKEEQVNPRLIAQIEEALAEPNEPKKAPRKQPLPGTQVFSEPREAFFATDIYIG